MPISELDVRRLLEAAVEAESAIGLTDPNPRVGCIVSTADGTGLAVGHTQEAGGPHAEVMALRHAQSQGLDLKGGTAWVTLEPCAHHGRTPPCCDALIAAGLSRVVVAAIDPFPAVAGQGVSRLRAHGVTVDVLSPEHALARRTRELNIGFFSRVERGRPWVRLKVATSVDGATALSNGQSQWITGTDARRDGHAWRRRAGAVVTGVGTVLADDPRLDVREVQSPKQPLRVVMDSHLRTPAQAAVLRPEGQVVVVCLPSAPVAAEHVLAKAGARIVRMPSTHSQVEVARVLAWLQAHSVNEVHVEAGATLNAAWLRSGLVDELLVYQAPMLLGPGGRPWAYLDTLSTLDTAPRFEIVETMMVGLDLRIRLRPAPALTHR